MRKRIFTVLISFAISIVGVAVPSGTSASTVVWNNGDVFAGVGLGTYKVYDNNGVGPKDVINDGHNGITTGCSFNPAQDKLYTTEWTDDVVVVYDRAVPHSIVQTIPTSGTGAATNESVVLASDVSFYVGHVDGNHPQTHFSPGRTLLH